MFANRHGGKLKLAIVVRGHLAHRGRARVAQHHVRPGDDGSRRIRDDALHLSTGP